MWTGMRFALVALLVVFQIARPQKVSTLNGPLLGQRLSVLGKSLDVFYGIPYSKPPLGDLRFKYPQPSESWGPEVRDAQKPTPSCIQPKHAFVPIETYRQTPGDYSEDCLHLTVWAPTDNSGHLAVMVWIYGGGWYFGSTRPYEGKYLAAENDVIVVSMNYRLGPLGFSYLGPDTIPGNMGLMDQRLVLQWVKDNIANFGGDPSQVTMFGESAGSGSVGHHLVSPLSRDVFDRAIMQSGTHISPWAYAVPKTAKRKMKRFADLLECPSSSTDADIYDCLKTADAQTMADVQLGMLDEGLGFIPVVDGYFLPDDPTTLLSSGSIKQTSVLHGFTKDETTLFSAIMLMQMRNVSTLPETLILSRPEYYRFLSVVLKRFASGKGIPEPLRLFYESQKAPLKEAHYFDVANHLLSDTEMKCPHLEFDRLYSPANPTYVYSFNHRLSIIPYPQWIGATHSYEVEFVFGLVLDETLGCTQEEVELSRTIMTYWTNFAKSGNPNAPVPVKVDWPASDNTDLTYMALDVGINLVAGHGVAHHECVFINRILPMITTDPPEGQEYCTRG